MVTKILLFFCVIAFQTTHAQHTNFSLEGKTADIEDGSYLYFRDLVNGGDIDSAMVKDNHFRFDTELSEPAMFVMLFTKDRSKFKELWLEDKPMTFNSSNVDFTEAEVTGSQNQILFKKLNEEVWANYQEADKTIIKQNEKEFIKNHPDALVSAFILFGNKLWNQNEIGEAFSSLSKEVQNSSLGQKKIASYLEKDLPEPGEKYLDFSIPNTEGENMRISDLTKKLTLLQFWSSSCGFSRTMNTTLSDVHNKYNSEGFEIISISKDTNIEAWLQAINEDELSWPQLSNLQSWDGEAFKAYGIHSTPSNFLINSDGIIVERNLEEDQIEEVIKAYLKK